MSLEDQVRTLIEQNRETQVKLYELEARIVILENQRK